MMSNGRNDLLASIAATIADYRLGEIDQVSPSHVDRWISQFNLDEQLAILTEMDHLLKGSYLSKLAAQEELASLFAVEEIFGTDPREVLPRVQFLRLQNRGTSQQDLLGLLDDIMADRFGPSASSLGGSASKFVYIDDGLYTGNRVRRDIERWLASDTAGEDLFIVLLATHTTGQRYVERTIQRLIEGRQLRLTFLSSTTYRNDMYSPGRFDCFWPRRSEDPEVHRYIERITQQAHANGRSPRLFRLDSPGSSPGKFSSSGTRHVVEQAFLREGARILARVRAPHPSMRPMGYEYLESLGFGAMFVTYRNISNSCPLVMWWGDPSLPDSHPLGGWYPLFPRRTNDADGLGRRVREDDAEYTWVTDEVESP